MINNINYLESNLNNIFKFLYLLLAIICISFFSCKPQTKGEPLTKLAETYFEYVKSGESDKAIALYSDRMFEKVPKDNWLKTLSVYREFQGDLKSYKLELSKQVQNKQKEYSGNYSYLVYRVEYANREAQEVITIRQPIGGGNSEIAAHYLNVEIVEPSILLERVFSNQSNASVKKES